MKNDDYFAKSITRHLNLSLESFPHQWSESLRVAREHAVDAHAETVGITASHQGAAAMAFKFWRPHHALTTVLALLIAMTILAAGWTVWESHIYIQEVEQFDSALLTDDLPLDAYFDDGFEEWLNTPSAQLIGEAESS